MKPILSDTSKAYPVYIYEGLNLDRLETEAFLRSKTSRLKEIHILITSTEDTIISCQRCECRNCPFISIIRRDESHYDCDDKQYFAIQYPTLLNDYPEFFI